ncbi:hypothetical protein D3C86_1688990 [compost metagenome]
MFTLYVYSNECRIVRSRDVTSRHLGTSPLVSRDPRPQKVRVDTVLHRHACHRHSLLEAGNDQFLLGSFVVDAATVTLAPHNQSASQLCVLLCHVYVSMLLYMGT